MRVLAFVSVFLAFALAQTFCPAAYPEVACLVAPCDTPHPTTAECPDAERISRCVDNYCGGCRRIFYNAEGNMVCTERQDGDPCPEIRCGPSLGMPSVQCPNDPTVSSGPSGRCLYHKDTNTCGWEIIECPVTPPSNCREIPNTLESSAAACAIFCQYGYKVDENGCHLCECDVPPCAGASEPGSPGGDAEFDDAVSACAPIECNDGRLEISAETCCPVCEPNVDCSFVSCARPECPEDRLYTEPGECCPRCAADCTASTGAPVVCPEIACGENFDAVRGPCGCDICVPRVTCNNVVCPAIACDPTTSKAIVREGQCCPVCVPTVDCSLVDCAQSVTCEAGFESVTHDLSCCPSCEPTDRCKLVKCARPDCPEELWIVRDGTCCAQCPGVNCKETTASFSSDRNDNCVCRPGFTRGPDCAEPVPETDRDVIIIKWRLLPTSRFYEYRNDLVKLKFLLANAAGITRPEYITIEVDPSVENGFILTISREKGDESIDPAQTETNLRSAMASDPASFSLDTNTDSSDAGILSVGVAAFVLALLA